MALPDNELHTWFVKEVLPLEAALTRFLYRNCRAHAEILDLRQETYVRVFEAARHSLPRQVKPFVFSAARNLLIDRFRRARIVSIDSVADLERSIVATEDGDPERVLIDRDELRRLSDALENLPPRCREVVAMRKIDGMAQRDVAHRLGIAESTVEKQVGKGIRLLADMLFGVDDPVRHRRVLRAYARPVRYDGRG